MCIDPVSYTHLDVYKRQLYEQYADLLYGYGMKIAGDDDLVTDAIQTLSLIHISSFAFSLNKKPPAQPLAEPSTSELEKPPQ